MGPEATNPRLVPPCLRDPESPSPALSSCKFKISRTKEEASRWLLPPPPASLGNRAGPPCLRAVSSDRVLPEIPSLQSSVTRGSSRGGSYLHPGVSDHCVLHLCALPTGTVQVLLVPLSCLFSRKQANCSKGLSGKASLPPKSTAIVTSIQSHPTSAASMPPCWMF